VVKLRAGIGTSFLPDAVAAGRDAAAQALTGLDGQAPALLLVYAALRYDLSALLSGVRSHCAAAPLVGASSIAQFGNGELTPPGTGVSVMALGAGDYRFGVSSVTGLRDTPHEAGRELARAAQAAVGARRGPGALLLFADGLSGDLQSFLNGIYRVAGAAVPVVGGAASPDWSMTETLVFHDDQVLRDAAVAVWIDSERPVTVACAHGWRSSGLPLLVTKVDGPLVHELGGRPADEVYRENFRQPDLADDGRGEDGFYASHAFGLIEPDGSKLIRGAYLDENKQLRTFAPLPPFSAVEVMSCDQEDLLDVSEKVVNDALAGGEASVLLAFSCMARMQILGERSGEEVARLQAAAGSVPTFGFYTAGEFARTTSVSGYHNATIAALVL
jgi:hypothetical protein